MSTGITGDDGPGALLALYENGATGPSGHSLLHNLDFDTFRQGKLSMNDFLAKLNQFFKTKEMCTGETMTNSAKCAAIMQRVRAEHVQRAPGRCFGDNAPVRPSRLTPGVGLLRALFPKKTISFNG